MEKKEFRFPPISGRGDLPASIYIDTLSPDEIIKRKRLGYKLIVPIAEYVQEEYLSIGAQGFFLSRLAEYISENTNILISRPIWVFSERSPLLSLELEAIRRFELEIVLLRERSSLLIPPSFRTLTIEEIFKNIEDRNYQTFSGLFYLALIPEFTHIEKMKGIKSEKINFSIYNDALVLLKKLIIHITNLIE